MIAKEVLTSASEMNRQIHYKEIELKSLRDLASGISGCGFGERLSGTRNTDPPFVRYTDKALELEKEIQNDKCKLSEYLMFLSWKEISTKMGYSKRWVIKLHEKAVENFSENWTP